MTPIDTWAGSYKIQPICYTHTADCRVKTFAAVRRTISQEIGDRG